jgi:hypothetical protein
LNGFTMASIFFMACSSLDSQSLYPGPAGP